MKYYQVLNYYTLCVFTYFEILLTIRTIWVFSKKVSSDIFVIQILCSLFIFDHYQILIVLRCACPSMNLSTCPSVRICPSIRLLVYLPAAKMKILKSLEPRLVKELYHITTLTHHASTFESRKKLGFSSLFIH